MDAVQGACRYLYLNSAARQAERLHELVETDPDAAELGTAFRELMNRIEDELKERTFMIVPPERAAYFAEDPPPFGQAVQGRFPEMTADIADASWCLGAGRWSAAVYHLMCVLEYAIRRLAKRLKVPKAQVEHRPWGAILSALNAAVSALPNRAAEEKSKRERYSEALAHLGHVKDAWRNPTMHSRRRYNQEEAEAIFRGVKTFVNHLATEVL
jgi:hypothetical protein